VSDILEEIIVPFVANFDRPFKYGEALHRLWLANAFEPPDDLASCPPDKLASFVGAHYCAMIREDVFYRLPEGIQLARRSRAAAVELENRANSDGLESGQLYSLIRWTDALGRLYYRTGNYTLARLEFEKCKSLMKSRDDFYWCWPDIESNLQRTIFEISFQVDTYAQKAGECYQALITGGDTALEYLSNESNTVRQKELKRGAASCYHNSLRCGAYIKAEASTLLSIEETINRINDLVIDDEYRKAQLENAIGQQKAQQNIETAKQIFKKLLKSSWPRGRFFGRQNLASLNEDVPELLKLCEEIEVEALANGGNDVLDLDRFDWTLKLAEKQQSSMDDSEKVRLEKIQQKITGAISSVISVATYRFQFEKKIRPRIRKLIDARTQDFSQSNHKTSLQAFDQLVDFVESFASREVLEVLRSNRSRNTTSQVVSAAKYLVDVPDTMAKASASDAEPETNQALAHASPSELMDFAPVAEYASSEKAELEANAALARQEDERYWLDNPLKIRDNFQSPSQRARQLTMADGQAMIVRFSQVQGTGGAKIIAFWWFRGESGVTSLGGNANSLVAEFLSPKEPYTDRFHVDEKDRNANTRIPKQSTAKDLWNEFMAPVLADISSKESFGKSLKIRSLTIVLEPGLYHLPLNFSWVDPTKKDWFVSGCSDAPLAMTCDLAFSLNLSAHLLEGRRDYGICRRLSDDEFFVLHHCPQNTFAGEKKMALIDAVVEEWDPHKVAAKLYDSASREEIVECFNARPEYLMLACHGGLGQSGSFLEFNNCHLVSANLAYSVALSGNRLLVLGACDSATPSPDSYGQFIGAFIAAGAGAVLANPCRSAIFTICGQAASLFDAVLNSLNSVQPVDLAKMLAASARVLAGKYPCRVNSIDAKLHSSTFQLWL
jgi:hypothetical protein